VHTFELICPECAYLVYTDTILDGPITLPDGETPASCSSCGWRGKFRDLQQATSIQEQQIGEPDYQI
jgi:hypothetical protein